MVNQYSELVYSGARLGLPLLFAVWGAMISYRAGVFNVALEGFIMVGAFTHCVMWEVLKYRARFTAPGALLGALLITLVVGALLGAFFGTLVARGLEPITSGIALNMAVLGIVKALEKAVLDPMLQSYGNGLEFDAVRTAGITDPVTALAGVALAGIVILIFVYYRTPSGKRMTAAGRPDGGAEALRQTGRSVPALWIKTSISTGVLCAFAGISLVWLTGAYTRDMSAGRGYVALALALIGNRSIVLASIVALAYGVAQSPQLLDILDVKFPPQIVTSFPYWLTLLILSAVGLYSRLTRHRRDLRLGHRVQ